MTCIFNIGMYDCGIKKSGCSYVISFCSYVISEASRNIISAEDAQYCN